MSRVITGKAFAQALLAAGVLDSLDTVRRIVIDSGEPGDAVVMYIERFGDERLLQVATTLDGVEIRAVPAPAAVPASA